MSEPSYEPDEYDALLEMLATNRWRGDEYPRREYWRRPVETAVLVEGYL